MQFDELMLQLQALAQEPGASGINTVIKEIAESGSIKDKYAAHMRASSECRDFLEAIYADDSLDMELSWAKIADFLHPDEWLSHFPAHATVLGFAPEQHELILKAPNINKKKSIKIDEAFDKVNIYVFHDGHFNKGALTMPKSYDNICSIVGTGIDLPSKYSIYRYRDNIIFLLWNAPEFEAHTHHKGSGKCC